MPTVHANDIDIYFEAKGDGEAVLLIAGYSCDLTIWSKVAALLAPKYRVIAFDNRGVGRSSAPDRPYSTRQMADDAAALLDSIGVKQAHVVGHSMGGQIAQELALAHPAKVLSLSILQSFAKLDERGKAIIESWGELPRQVDAVTAARLCLPLVHTSSFYARPGAIQQVIGLMANNPFPAPAHGIYHQSRATSGADSSGRLAEIRCPTLVLGGTQDILIPLSYSEELIRGIPGAERAVVDGAGHGILIEMPETVAQIVSQFISRHQGNK